MENTEIKLIIACARTKLTSEIRACITELASRIENWQKLIYLASFHRVVVLLYQSLKNVCPDSVPPETFNQLKKIYTDNAVKNLSLSIKLLNIINLFKQNNIQVIPFKGPVIAEKAYGDLNLRSFTDLDILIKRKDIAPAKKLLIENGFKAEITLSTVHEQKYLKHENSFSFYDKNNLSIDLHWEITGRYLLNPIYFETFEKRLETASLLGKKIVSIPDDVMLVYLCIHGTSHCWDRFEWLCCLVELIEKQDEKTVLNALTFADAKRAKRIFLLGLYLGQDLLGAQYPEKIKKAIASDPGIIQCADKIKKNMFNQKTYPDGDAAWRFSPVHILLRDSYFDRLRYLFYLLTMPTIKEWIKYPVPYWLTPLYRILRPFRLAAIFFFGDKSGNSFVSSMNQRIKEMIAKKRAKGSGPMFIFFLYVPGRFIEKLFSNAIALLNKHFYNKYINIKRLSRFHNQFKSKMNKQFYIIGMPGKIHFLDPCIELVHNDINLFIVLNGVKKNEKKIIQDKYPDVPVFELKTFAASSMPHGEVINLLLYANEDNFGLIDHDLYIFNKEIFNQLEFVDNEYIAGSFELHNRKACITFPATFFLFINTKIVKRIMCKYKIGAQIYSKIPSNLAPILKKMNLGYDNFLKDYLNYFDPFNLIFAMATHEGYKAKILKTNQKDMIHLGGYMTNELMNDPDKTLELIESIRSRKV